MKTAHFIESNIIFSSGSRPVIIDRNNPSKPITKIEPYDFELFKSGIYKGQNNKIDFNGNTFWLSNEFIDKLKILTKKLRIDMSNLAISMQEYLNKELIDTIPFTINLDIFKKFINSDNSDIYIICSKNTESKFENQIKKLESELSEMKLSIKKFYFISNTFYLNNDDHLSYIKCNLILQHLTGLKIEGDKFTEEEVERYNEISFYDDNKKSIKLATDMNKILEQLILKSESREKLLIKEVIKDNDIVLIIKEFTHNKINEFVDKIVELEYSNVIRNFENFKFK